MSTAEIEVVPAKRRKDEGLLRIVQRRRCFAKVWQAGSAAGPAALFWIVSLASIVVMGLAAERPSWIDVPFVRQVRAGCGPAAIAMVMQYWVRQQPGLDAVAADVERINTALPSSSQGTSGNDLKQYLEAHGFSAFVFNGEPKDLDHHLAKGRPLVVCLAPEGAGEPLHYVVVVGAGEREILFNDSAREKLMREGRDAFLKQWKVTGGWTLLAVPRQAQ